MSNGTILDVARRILRRRWAVLLGIGVLFVGPGALLTAAASMRFNDVISDVFLTADGGTIDLDTVVTTAQIERLLDSLAVYLGATVLAGLIASIGTVVFGAVVGADYLHRPMSLTEALRVSLRRALSALAFIAITTVIVIALALGALLLVALATSVFGGGALDQGGPGIFLALLIAVALVVVLAYLTMRWAPALPAMANEDLGWRAAMARSWHLSGDSVWRIFFIVLFGSLVTALIALVLGLLIDTIVVSGIATSLGLDPTVAMAISTALVSVLVAAILPVMTAVLYFDLRTRRDSHEAAPVLGEQT
jgi:hypothetical protein